MYIYVILKLAQAAYASVAPLVKAGSGSQQPKTYPHPRIPAARLFFILAWFSVFYSTWGNPEAGGGDNFLGSQVPESDHLRTARGRSPRGVPAWHDQHRWMVFIYIYIYIHAHIHSYIHRNIHTYIHTYIHISIYIYIYVLHAYNHIYTYVCVYIYI